MAGLGLSVAVVDRVTGRLGPGADRGGVERLARGHHPPHRGQRPQSRALGEHPVLGRRLAEDRDPLALDQLEPVVGIEARVDEHRRRAAEPRRDEDVARRLRPPGSGRAPDQLARPGAEPLLGLESLGAEVALRVHRRPRLAGGPRGEHDQRRVARIEVGDRGRRLLRAVLVERLGQLGEGHVRDSRRGARRAAARRRCRAMGSRSGSAARGRRGAAGCCRAAPPRPCASTRAGPGPTRAGCRPGS